MRWAPGGRKSRDEAAGWRIMATCVLDGYPALRGGKKRSEPKGGHPSVVAFLLRRPFRTNVPPVGSVLGNAMRSRASPVAEAQSSDAPMHLSLAGWLAGSLSTAFAGRACAPEGKKKNKKKKSNLRRKQAPQARACPPVVGRGKSGAMGAQLKSVTSAEH